MEGSEVAKKDGKDGKEEEYYVKRSCYGQTQTDRSTKLLSGYWDQRLLWSAKFDKASKLSVTEVYRWIANSSFRNIGNLSALLICGDLIEAGILLMPTAHEWGGLIHSLNMEAKSTMEMLGFIRKQAGKAEVTKAFTALDLALQQELTEEEKAAMKYNVVMLEHTLCKIKRLTSRGIAMRDILEEI